MDRLGLLVYSEQLRSIAGWLRHIALLTGYRFGEDERLPLLTLLEVDMTLQRQDGWWVPDSCHLFLQTMYCMLGLPTTGLEEGKGNDHNRNYGAFRSISRRIRDPADGVATATKLVACVRDDTDFCREHDETHPIHFQWTSLEIEASLFQCSNSC